MKKRASPTKKDKKKQKDKDNRDSHPLNLPPDELRRLSAVMAAQEEARKSVDMDTNVKEASPKNESPSTPLKTVPGSFHDDPVGASNGINGDYGVEKSPTPPPHRVPVPEKPVVNAEAAKAAGNKYFKAKDYVKAISEYSKG
jgi:DnaJ homolog subfamily C member 7